MNGDFYMSFSVRPHQSVLQISDHEYFKEISEASPPVEFDLMVLICSKEHYLVI
jgi:hypothetical protein